MSTFKSNGFRPGVYRHYKGNKYLAYEVAKHSESHEDHVVYRCLYGEKGLWLRPLSMFLESVEVNGVSVPRFEWVAEISLVAGEDHALS